MKHILKIILVVLVLVQHYTYGMKSILKKGISDVEKSSRDAYARFVKNIESARNEILTQEKRIAATTKPVSVGAANEMQPAIQRVKQNALAEVKPKLDQAQNNMAEIRADRAEAQFEALKQEIVPKPPIKPARLSPQRSARTQVIPRRPLPPTPVQAQSRLKQVSTEELHIAPQVVKTRPSRPLPPLPRSRPAAEISVKRDIEIPVQQDVNAVRIPPQKPLPAVPVRPKVSEQLGAAKTKVTMPSATKVEAEYQKLITAPSKAKDALVAKHQQSISTIENDLRSWNEQSKLSELKDEADKVTQNYHTFINAKQDLMATDVKHQGMAEASSKIYDRLYSPNAQDVKLAQEMLKKNKKDLALSNQDREIASKQAAINKAELDLQNSLDDFNKKSKALKPEQPVESISKTKEDMNLYTRIKRWFSKDSLPAKNQPISRDELLKQFNLD